MKYLLLLLLLTACRKSDTPTYAQVGVQVTCFLEGCYNPNTALMTKEINRNGLPIAQPYNDTPWLYTGTEHITPGGHLDSNVVDWCLIEVLHNGSVRGRAAVLIEADGHCVDMDGRAAIPITLFEITTDTIYDVVLRHRNHLAVRTKYPVNLSHTGIINFSVQGVCYQNQSYTPTVFSGGPAGRWCMRMGDSNKDGQSRNNGPSNDFLFIRDSVLRGQPSIRGYLPSDINMDGYVNALDLSWYGDWSFVYRAQL